MPEELFASHINLVYKIAKRMDYGYVDREDLIQVGLMGLYEASLKYDPHQNTKFTTFASIYIISSIKAELRKNKLIRLNKELISLVRKIKNCDNNMSIEELANYYNTSKENIILALSYSFEVSSLNVTAQNDEIIHLIPDNVQSNTLQEDIMARIKTLDPISQKVIYLKYYEGLSQEKIATILGKNQSSISRLEKKALKKMKEVALI